MTDITKIFLPLILSFVISYLITPLVIKLAKKTNVLDDPKTNKHPKVLHDRALPRSGGLATFFAIFVSSIIFLPLDQHLSAILIGAILITFIGVLDDIYNLNPYIRFTFQIIVAAIPIIGGIGIAYISNPLGTGLIDLTHPQFNFFLLGEERSIWLISDLFALVWIVFMMNILNIGAKGVDGQLPGVVVISAITIAILSIKFSADITEWPLIILALILTGSYLGFLPWNFFPQKIMPGFSGSTLAGYMLAILSILSTTKVGTLLVVLGVPLVDTGYAVFRRLLAGKSPFWGDRSHLHHKLIDLGFSKKTVSYIYWISTAFLGLFALNLNSTYKLYALFGVIIGVAGFLMWITYNPKETK
jgi:UDP-GlcNAc:undecaprenyl-phosphate GlcNAc-1-phosphate transferase